MLTPDDITKKTFTVRHIRGYDPEEVDDFLDQIVTDYKEVIRQLKNGPVTQKLPVIPTAPPPPLPVAPNPIGDVARLLAVAQQAADQQAAEAKVAANQVIADAQAAGSKLVTDANAQAAQIVAEGTAKRNEIVGALEVQRSDLQSKLESLKATHAETVAKLKAALEQLGDAA